MKKKLSLLMVALVAIAAFAGLRRAAEQVVTYALAEGDTFTSGQTVDVKDGEDVVATITYGFSGGEDFKAATAQATLIEQGFAAFTAGNGVNGTENSGTCYIITPKFAGSIDVAVVLNAGKPFYILEDGTALTDYNGITVEAKYYGTYSFQVKANSVYKVYCTGSKLGFYGFKYTYEVEEQGGGGDPVDQPTDEGWVKTAPEDLVTGDVVVIVDQAKSVALPNNSGTSSPSQVTVTLNDDKSQIAGDVASTIQWVVTKDGDNYQFNIANTSNYLYVTASNSGVRVGSGERNTFTVKTGGDNNGYYLFNTAKKSDDTDDDRYIGAYSTSDWRCYTSINSNIKGNNNAFYKKTQVPVAVARPTFSVEPGAYTSAQSVELTTLPADAKIYYTLDGTEPSASSTPYEAAISVTATTTIKAIAIKGEDKSKIATAEYTILESIANTKATAYTVSEAYTMIFGDDTTDPATAAKPAEVLAHKDNVVFVKGTVKSVKGVYDSGNATYIITDGTKELTVYNGLYLEGAAFSDVNKANLAVGKEVIVKGNLLKYNTVAELAAGNELVSLSFNVTVSSEITNGSVIVDKQTAANGDEVTITATPAEGYALLSCTVTCKTIDQIVEVKDGKFIMPADDVTVSATFVQPEDITIAPESGDINEALKTATAGKIAKNITINLAENGAYTVSAPIVSANNLIINGAAGATIDASGNAGDFITLQGSTVFAKKSDDTDSDHYLIAAVSVSDVKISGLKGALITDAQKTLLETLTISNAVVEMPAAGKNVINFNGKGYVGKVVVKNSTIWANGMNTGFFAQYGSRPKNVNGDWLQEFDVQNSTIVNIANGKNICDLKQNGTAQNVYTLKNNIFVDCGKSAQVVVGFNKGQTSATPVWAVDGNIFNFGGVDTSAAEVEKAGKAGEEDIVKNSIAGVVTFTDAAAGDFNGKITLPIGAVVPEGKVGDPRWTVAYKETGAVLWSSEEPATIVWDQANITIPAEQFANAKVGDVMHVMLQDVKVGTNTWDAQVELRGQNYKALEGAAFVAGTESAAAATSADFVLTGDILAIAKAMGVQINGTDCKTALITLEYADKVAGSDVSIWVGNATKANIALNKAHFANSNLFGGIKVGDKIRLTVKKTDPEGGEWIGLNYQSPTWAWSEFAEGSFATTVTPTEDGAIVDYEVKTAEVAQILNVDNAQIIVNNPNQTVTQVELIIAPVDIVISPEEGADIYAALKAETDKVAKVGNISVYLAPGKKFTISQSIVAPAAFVIMGAAPGTDPSSIDETATMAEIDASTLTGPLVQMSAEPAVDADANGFYPLGDVGFLNVKVTGLTQQLFYANKVKYLFNCFHLDFCNINIAGGSKTVIDTNGGGVIATLDMSKNTIWANPENTGALYSSQSGQKATEAGLTVQTFNIERNTIYNIAYGKNFCSHRQSNQTWLTYNVRNNVFVNCGKIGQVIKGLNGGSSGANPTWNIDGNVFNFDGKDTSADESTGDADEPVKNSLAGIFAFTDAAAGDFNGVFKGKTAEAPAKYPGDPRWTYTYEIAPTDIVISPESGADIAAALSAAKEGILKVGNITINLTAGAAYTLSETISAPNNLIIKGEDTNPAIVTMAESMTDNVITLAGTEKYAKKADGTDSDHKLISSVEVTGVKLLGLQAALIKDTQKTLLENLTIKQSIIEMPAAGKNVIDFNSQGYVGKVAVTFSTIYAKDKNTGFFAQYGSRPKNVNGDWLQEFDVQNSTIVNIANGKNICDLKQNGTAQNVYTLKNNIFVDCGKNGQVVVGFNKGQGSATPVWDVDKNLFNFGGVDTSATEVEKAGKAGEEDIVKNSVAGIIKFQDAAAGNFNASLTLAPGTETAPESVGDPRWTLNLEMGYAIAIGEVTNGTMTVSATYAAAGDKIYPTMTPAEGYAMDKLPVVKNDAGEDVTASISFGQDEKGVYILMPAFNITVSYEFSKLYDITLPTETTYGTVTLVNGGGEAIADTKFVAGKEVKIKVADLTTGYKVVATSGETEITLNEGDHTKFDYYFTMPEGDVTISIVNATGINSITADKMKNATIYNMKGQRVDKAQKGLYIINGKKVVIK